MSGAAVAAVIQWFIVTLGISERDMVQVILRHPPIVSEGANPSALLRVCARLCECVCALCM